MDSSVVRETAQRCEEGSGGDGDIFSFYLAFNLK